MEDSNEKISLIEKAAARVDKLSETNGEKNGAGVKESEIFHLMPNERGQEPRTEAINEKKPLRRCTISLAHLRNAGIMAPDAPRTKSREEFRIIKRNILLRFRQMRDVGTERANIVMVTAAGPGEGKTFTAANLAISLSQEPDLDVLLVDTDVSKPSLPSTFGISEGPGITDILADKGMHPEDVILRTNFERLSLVSAGRHAENSTEFFASERMRDVTDEISRLYHKGIVIFDSPPVLATSEATSLVMHVGQVVFVVEADGTDREAIRKSLDLLSVCPNIGMVLNKVRPQFGATEFGTYYHYYDRK